MWLLTEWERVHVPSLYIQLLPPTTWEVTNTQGHLSESKKQIQTQSAATAKRVSSGGGIIFAREGS